VAVLPFLVAYLIVIVVVCLMPGIVTALPDAFYG
jgi:TRAP-type C4-dicarboxylate transport system permease large subunit